MTDDVKKKHADPEVPPASEVDKPLKTSEEVADTPAGAAEAKPVQVEPLSEVEAKEEPASPEEPPLAEAVPVEEPVEKPTQHAAEETMDAPLDSPFDEPPPVKDGFQPFYKKEARVKSSVSFFLYALLAVLAAGLLCLGLETWLESAPFRLEATTIIVICIALLVFLRKIISMEALVGLSALSIGLIMAVSHVAYGMGLSLGGLPKELFLSIYFCLFLGAGLLGIWYWRPGPRWVPLVLTLLLVYGALAPVLSLIQWRAGPGTSPVLGPDFMSGWPIYIRSGYLMVQVFLPLCAIIYLILQVRTIIKPQYQSHWGFIFWGLALFLASAVGLADLETSGQPAFPHMRQLAVAYYPGAAPLTSVAAVSTETAGSTEVSEEPKAPPAAPAGETAPTAPVKTEPAAPGAPVKEEAPETPAAAGQETAAQPEKPEETAAPKPEAAAESAPVQAEPAKETAPATGEPRTEAVQAPEETQPAPAETVEPAAGQAAETGVEDTAKLADRIRSLEDEVNTLKGRLNAQDRLIKSLLEYFMNQPGFKSGLDTPTPGVESTPSPEEKQPTGEQSTPSGGQG